MGHSGSSNEPRSQQDHERGARHAGHALAREHQREHHRELLPQRELDARGLRHEDRASDR